MNNSLDRFPSLSGCCIDTPKVDQRQMLIERYQSLDDQVRRFDSSVVDKYLNLTREACGTTWFPTKEKELETYGEPRATTLRMINKTACKFNWGEVFNKMNDILRRLQREKVRANRTQEENDASDNETPEQYRHKDVTTEELEAKIAEMEAWLQRMPLLVAGFRVMMAIIKDYISEKAEKLRILEASEEFKTKLPVVNAEIVALHDRGASVRHRGRHCFIFYSDGEIVSTKAGEDLFGARSMFTVKPPIAGISHRLFNFPERWNNGQSLTYVVVEDKVTANSLRNKMLQLYGMPTEEDAGF